MKRILAVILVIVILAGALCGCGKKKKNDSSVPDKDPAATSGTSVSAAPTPETAPTPEPQMAKAVKVNASDGLNIREKPSTDCNILGLAENGSMLPLLMENPSNGWYEVEYGGKGAYVSAEYVTVVSVTLDVYNQLKQSGGTAPTASPAAGDKDPGADTSSTDTVSGEDAE